MEKYLIYRHVGINRSTDRWADGLMDGKTDRWMNGRTNEHTVQTEGWIDKQTGRPNDRQPGRQADRKRETQKQKN
jgi:hypothetical protein